MSIIDQQPSSLKHVAFIMDGNGTWGVERGGARTDGHVAGARTVKPIVTTCIKLGIPAATFWGFSTENWKRPDYEIKVIMSLFEKFIIQEADDLFQQGIMVRFLGRRSELNPRLQRIMQQVEERTAGNNIFQLHVAINFSGAQAYADAAATLAKRGEVITEAALHSEMFGDSAAYDLVIRTGGEQRVSDFPVGHAELAFTATKWPAFTPEEFCSIIDSFTKRERRFGAVVHKAAN